MSKTDPTLAQEAKANPQDTFRVIVRVQGDLDTCQEQLETLGFTITRRLRLIQGLAGTATGEAVLRAMGQDWVAAIERDAEMRTMSDESW